MIAGLLRGVAIAIAVAAIVDPPVTTTARGRPRIALALQNPALEPARDAHQRLADLLRSEFDVVPGSDATADAAVIVGTGYPDPAPPDRQRTYTVTMAPADGEGSLRIRALRAPRDVPPGTLVHLDVEVEGANVRGATSTLVVRAGNEQVEVARATHAWTAAAGTWRATLDVPPLGAPPWRLRVEVSGAAGERDLTDNSADAIVAVAEPLRVLVYEPRLSWAGTFVRHALERDSRFDVAAVAYPSRGVQVTTPGTDPPADAPLIAASAGLNRMVTDRTRAIIVGGLDRATAEDAGVLSRFMRERGGAVVLLPDSHADARTAARWLPVPAAAEVLLEQPARLSVEAPLASIHASELLTFEPAPILRALATNSANLAVIGVMPVGAGQLIVSGALDAWRFRANDGAAFDRFWQSAIAGFAGAAPPAIDVVVVPPIVAPGEKAGVRVRLRRAALALTPGTDLRVTASLAGGDVVRLWPDAEPDSFVGAFTAPPAAGAGRITVTVVNGVSRSVSFMIARGARAATPAGPALSLLAESRGGRDFSAGEIQTLTRTLRQEIAAPAVRAERRPMRSLWWLAPFVACLGGEWWLRRRRGLR
jgi:hypothetical protein